MKPRTEPLRRRRHEAFVDAFARSFDGPTAARRAGYAPALAERIWPVLLRSPEVRARLQALTMPAVDPTHAALRRRLVDTLTTDFSGLLTTDPVTGTPRIDLAAATPEQLALLEFEVSITETARGPRQTLHIRSPNRPQAMRLLATHLGDPPPPESSFATALADIISRGSPMPIRQEIEED